MCPIIIYETLMVNRCILELYRGVTSVECYTVGIRIITKTTIILRIKKAETTIVCCASFPLH
jgi:hypothetical protein